MLYFVYYNFFPNKYLSARPAGTQKKVYKLETQDVDDALAHNHHCNHVQGVVALVWPPHIPHGAPGALWRAAAFPQGAPACGKCRCLALAMRCVRLFGAGACIVGAARSPALTEFERGAGCAAFAPPSLGARRRCCCCCLASAVLPSRLASALPRLRLVPSRQLRSTERSKPLYLLWGCLEMGA
jgi:hypothetical protein